jgi:hypothetical protein
VYFFSTELNKTALLTGRSEKQALDWNPQGVRRSGRREQTLKKTVVEEVANCKTWSEVKRLAKIRVRWRCFTDALCS